MTIQNTTCCVCGIDVYLPKAVMDARRKDGKAFYCANGHSLSFGDSRVDVLQRELDKMEKNRDEWIECTHSLNERIEGLENALRSERGRSNAYKGLYKQARAALNRATGEN